MQKNEWKGQNVTVEDVAASLKPLMDEYLERYSHLTFDEFMKMKRGEKAN